MRFTVFSNYSKLPFVLHILTFSRFLLRWCASCKLSQNEFRSSYPTWRTQCIEDLQCFEPFRNSCFFYTFWLFRNYNSGDAHHINYGKHSLNNHFRHSAHSVYKIYSVFKLFEFAVCFANFDFFEITTPVMRIMLTMANIVQIIISDMAHTVYINFTVFSNFRNYCSAHFVFFGITTPVVRIVLSMANIV